MIRSIDPNDTIAAVASPVGPALRGLIRVTGPKAWSIVLEKFVTQADLVQSKYACLIPGRLNVDGLPSGLPVDLALWPGPRTYTGQPLVEIHAPGSPPLLDLVLSQILSRGARLAEPGEFTLRAFLSGRIDLTRAEAVLGVIDARSTGQLDAALKQLAGGLARPIDVLRDRLLDILAHLEANLDFSEEPDVDTLSRSHLSSELAHAADDVAKIAAQLSGRDRRDRPPRVVLTGLPNAGKSRLFNALAGEDRAIVSDIAGTTRDYLIARMDCDGLEVELIDTAGEDESGTGIEHQAQGFRSQQVNEADLVLNCHPINTPLFPSDWQPDPAQLAIWTKADLGPSRAGLLTSATTGLGITELKTSIAQRLQTRADGDLPAGTAARCRESLGQASDALRSATTTLLDGGGDELVSLDLRQAIDGLGAVLGLAVDDEILDRIFRKFCIGK